jgi:uncharacterized protein (DUF58 family)
VLTDRGKALVGVGIALWLLSRTFNVPELQMAAVATLGLLALAVLFTRVTSAQLETRRRVSPSRLFYDAEGRVRIELRNVGRFPTALMQVEDAAPASLADGARFVLPPLRPGASVTVEYDVHARHRGRYEVGPLTVRLRDPFGVAARVQLYRRTDTLTVYPPVWALPRGVPLGGQPGRGGEGQPRPLPAGDELSNVREYVRGDDLRKVHWRSTAHRGKLMIRQDEAPLTPQATIVLDVRENVHEGHGPRSSFETAVATAASVTYHLATRRYATTLITQPITSPPRPTSWELALERLAILDLSRGAGLQGIWRQLGNGVAGNGVLVAIVAVPEPTDLRAMVRAGRGFATRLAVLVDSGSFGRRRAAGTEAIAEALRGADWRVTVIRSGDRLDERWNDLRKARRHSPVQAVGALR